MGRRQVLPVWNVYVSNMHDERVEIVNIYTMAQFMAIVKKMKGMLAKFKRKWKNVPIEQVVLDHPVELDELKNQLEEYLHDMLIYCFRAKCEYEACVTPYPPRYDYKQAKEEIKALARDDTRWYFDIHNIDHIVNAYREGETRIDIYSQVRMNYEPFKQIVMEYIGYNEYLNGGR